jgi:hypothetical protein
MIECTEKMIEYCEKNCDKENAKVTVAYNSCFLEKVIIKKRHQNQEHGLSFISLFDGIYTIGEITRHVNFSCFY